MGSFIYLLIPEFDFVVNDSYSKKIGNLLVILTSSSLIYFVLSIIFKSFSIKDFKLENYEQNKQ
jgi:hypothetical protein